MNQEPIPQGHENPFPHNLIGIINPSNLAQRWQKTETLNPDTVSIPFELDIANRYFAHQAMAKQMAHLGLTNEKFEQYNGTFNQEYSNLNGWKYSIDLNSHLNPKNQDKQTEFKPPEIIEPPVYNEATGAKYPSNITIRITNPQTREEYSFHYGQPREISLPDGQKITSYTNIIFKHQEPNSQTSRIKQEPNFAWLIINNNGSFTMKTPAMKKKEIFNPDGTKI